MTKRVRGIRNEKGQALVELALLLPFIMMLVLGVLEIGRAWQHKQTLTDARGRPTFGHRQRPGGPGQCHHAGPVDDRQRRLRLLQQQSDDCLAARLSLAKRPLC
jgi:hypothetical protein